MDVDTRGRHTEEQLEHQGESWFDVAPEHGATGVCYEGQGVQRPHLKQTMSRQCGKNSCRIIYSNWSVVKCKTM